MSSQMTLHSVNAAVVAAVCVCIFRCHIWIGYLLRQLSTTIWLSTSHLPSFHRHSDLFAWNAVVGRHLLVFAFEMKTFSMSHNTVFTQNVSRKSPFRMNGVKLLKLLHIQLVWSIDRSMSFSHRIFMKNVYRLLVLSVSNKSSTQKNYNMAFVDCRLFPFRSSLFVGRRLVFSHIHTRC